MGVQLDKWIEKVRRCEYLAEDELKALCEYVSTGLLHPSMLEDTKHVSSHRRIADDGIYRASVPSQVKEILVEESNVQPVNSPVTVSAPPPFPGPAVWTRAVCLVPSPAFTSVWTCIKR